MKIEVATNDLLPLRRLVEETHDRIKNYPIVKNGEEFDGTRAACLEDMKRLRKLYRRLTLACRKHYGHDCNPVNLNEESQ